MQEALSFFPHEIKCSQTIRQYSKACVRPRTQSFSPNHPLTPSYIQPSRLSTVPVAECTTGLKKYFCQCCRTYQNHFLTFELNPSADVTTYQFALTPVWVVQCQNTPLTILQNFLEGENFVKDLDFQTTFLFLDRVLRSNLRVWPQ